jgi:hypothetical protein
MELSEEKLVSRQGTEDLYFFIGFKVKIQAQFTSIRHRKQS